MVIAIIRIPKPADESAAKGIEERFRAQLPNVKGSAGFLGFELLRPAHGSEHYLSISRWESREALEAWAGSQYNARAHGHPTDSSGEAPAGPRPLPPNLELYEVAVS